MAVVEVTGKTLEEARQRAAKQLECEQADITVEIIDEPRRFLGIIGGAEYRIRATLGAPQGDVALPTPEASANTIARASHDVAHAATEADGTMAPGANETEQGLDEQMVPDPQESLEKIISLMGLDAEVAVKEANEEEVVLEVTGPDAGRIIGRHGATLDALQLLVAVMANRGHTRSCRVIIDAEGYRAKREEMLRDMAQTHATKAKEAGKEIVIRDLKPYERRIVHMALVDDPDVETYSEGEDDDRQLVISPTNV